MVEYVILGVILLTLVMFLLTIKYCKHYRNRKNYPPGPVGFPVLGHLPLFGARPFSTFRKWRNRYGDIFRIQLGTWDAVVLNGRDLIKEAFHLKGDAFSGRPNFYTGRFFRSKTSDTIGLGGFSKAWIQHKSIGISCLHRFMSKTDDTLQQIIETEVDHFVKSVVSNEAVVDKSIQILTDSIVYQIIFGTDKDVRKDKTFSATVKALDKFSDVVGNPIDALPWLRFFMPWKIITFRRIAKILDYVRNSKFKEHLETFCDENIRDLTDALIASAAELDNDSEITRERIYSTMNDFLFAGFQTLPATMKWALMYIAKYSKVQFRVQREIDDVVGSGRKICVADRTKLPYTEATILEVLRLSCVAPLAIPHFTTEDTSLNGYHIDKHTVVLANLHSVSFDDEYWDDPYTFTPSRFLAPDGSLDNEKCTRILSFGLGRRRCMGSFFARTELFLVFTSLLQRCSFNVSKHDPVSLEPVPALILKPKPFKLIVTER